MARDFTFPDHCPPRVPRHCWQETLHGKRASKPSSSAEFGTGYSSLSYLHRFPLDTLKIDRSFISVMEEDGEGMEIARSIVPMANNLRLDVVAEGVETIQQVALLKKLECKYGQGFYFSRPLSAEGIATLLAGDLTWQACEQTK